MDGKPYRMEQAEKEIAYHRKMLVEGNGRGGNFGGEYHGSSRVRHDLWLVGGRWSYRPAYQYDPYV